MFTRWPTSHQLPPLTDLFPNTALGEEPCGPTGPWTQHADQPGGVKVAAAELKPRTRTRTPKCGSGLRASGLRGGFADPFVSRSNFYPEPVDVARVDTEFCFRSDGSARDGSGLETDGFRFRPSASVRCPQRTARTSWTSGWCSRRTADRPQVRFTDGFS